MSKNTKPHLFLSIDFGGSLTKIVASLMESPECVAFGMEPYCYQLSDSEVLPNADFDENSTWVKYGGNFYAVGGLAKHQFSAMLEVKPPKVESMVQKTCAAVAVLAQKFNLPSAFNLTIACVLPRSEIIYRESFILELKAAFEDLETPKGKLTPKGRGTNLFPEGLGILKWHQQRKGISQIGVIMMGFRNASVLTSANGKIATYQTSDFGFHDTIAEICDEVQSYKIADAIEPIWNYLLDRDEKHLKVLLKSKPGSNYLIDELTALKRQIDISESKYLANLQNWLRGSLGVKLDYFVTCGGTSELVGKRLDEFLTSYLVPTTDLSIVQISRHIAMSSYPQVLNETGYPHRFADIFALWDDLRQK